MKCPHWWRIILGRDESHTMCNLAYNRYSCDGHGIKCNYRNLYERWEFEDGKDGNSSA